jgi:hypothetical protein
VRAKIVTAKILVVEDDAPLVAAFAAGLSLMIPILWPY